MGPVTRPAARTPRGEVRRTTRSARATFELGRALGAALQPGDVVALVGELGAGKTQLARGICRGAGVPDEEVASPSFAIVATYHGRITVHHADLYRVGDPDELYGTGFHELVGGAGAVLVEWADRLPGALPPERLDIHLAHDARSASARHLTALGTGARHAALAERLRPHARRRARPSSSAPASGRADPLTRRRAPRAGRRRARGGRRGRGPPR
jgi:tRNA threonylcarbamoyladenosine biosynthesis protein TsaE